MIKPKPKNQDAVELAGTKNRDCVLLFTTYESRKIAAILNNNVLQKVFVKEKGLPRGTICLGKVSEIKAEIGCAFLMIADKQKCFIQLSDLKDEYNLTRPGQSVKCGDSFVVKITKEPAKNKLASASTFLSEWEEQYRIVGASRTDYFVLKQGKSYIDNAIHYFNLLTDQVNQEGGKAVSLSTDNTKSDVQDKISPNRFRVITDDSEIYDKLTQPDSVLQNSAHDFVHLQKYEDSLVGLNVLFGLKEKIAESLSRHVWLKSGADIYIDRTEACTVIDVNSGKSSKNEEVKERYLSLNKEAAVEICHQIFLRNLSGIILIDFINLKSEDDRVELIEFMKELCKINDPQMHIIDITKLGIMETTRQKTGPSLHEQFES